jgi:hypothetical protein
VLFRYSSTHRVINFATYKYTTMIQSAESLALGVCLDRGLCSIEDKAQHPRLLIKRGARIIANTSHIDGKCPVPKGTEAITYTARQDTVLLIAKAGIVGRDKSFLLRLAFKKGKFTAADRLRAAHVCDVFAVDGWLVSRRYPKGEAMVLLNALQHLK